MSNTTIQTSTTGKPNTPSQTRSKTAFSSKPSTGSGPRSSRSKYGKKKKSSSSRLSTITLLPTKEYVSECCTLPAKKPALLKDTSGGKEQKGLGKWRCSSCGKRCKVSAHKAQPAEVIGANGVI